MAPPRIPLDKRFWPKIDQRGPDECWPWIAGRRHLKGYGKIRLPGRDGGEAPAHHVAWMLSVGPVPNGLQVLHRCDNPPCCNPAHLFLGTHADNMADKVAKGGQLLGERNPAAKLSDAQVVEIRRRSAAGEGARRLASEFGVSRRAIQFASRGTTWAHIGMERVDGAGGY